MIRRDKGNYSTKEADYSFNIITVKRTGVKRYETLVLVKYDSKS